MCAPEPCDDVAEIIRDPGRRRPLGKPLSPVVGLLVLAALAAPPARSDDSALLAVRVARAQTLVEKVRGAAFRAPVASALLPEKQLETVLAKKLVQDLPIPFEAYAAGLAALGLIEPSPGLLDRLIRLYTRQVVGFYDPGEKRFYIVPERSRDVAGPAGELMEQLLLAHELTHALQDQRLGLDRRMKALRDSTDALLALQAFLEGEATVLMTEALLESVPEEAREALGADPLGQVLDGLDDPDGVDGAEGVPAYFVRELVFPYAAGTAWVRQKKAAGGWPAVDAAYRRLPTTTREILRPGVVLPARLRLAPADRPTPRAVPGGGTASWADTLGEWVLGTLLEQAGAGDESRDAAAAWQDDRIVFSCPGKSPGAHGVGFLWRIRAATPAGAARIAELLGPLYATRPAPARPRISVRGDLVEVVRSVVPPPPA
ncbi:MAG TPA: hypothetical protein PLP50_04350 [Thermoanaerobaculia bacterium]|jgi:hypothetical protein|nr:hypothetical protein [Thermoanaerobaculia bacterium]HPA50813.1 hypothetical protein [Thermoanaerobaculia bacterium]HQN09501.1 hypothetical protein [Thermoanaerobaculia bacterium]HQP85562.1 hypothetical protein [Thermoanaerobaculia bacterium]